MTSEEAEEDYGSAHKYAFGATRSDQYAASVVADVSLPEGSVVEPDQSLLKTWLVTNDGDRRWPEGTRIVLVNGMLVTIHHDDRMTLGVYSIVLNRNELVCTSTRQAII